MISSLHGHIEVRLGERKSKLLVPCLGSFFATIFSHTHLSPFHWPAPAPGGQGKKPPGRHRTSFLSTQQSAHSSAGNFLLVDIPVRLKDALDPFPEVYPHAPSRLLGLQSSSFTHYRLLTNSEATCFCPKVCVYLYLSGQFCLHTNWTVKHPAHSYTCCRKSPSPMTLGEHQHIVQTHLGTKPAFFSWK